MRPTDAPGVKVMRAHAGDVPGRVWERPWEGEDGEALERRLRGRRRLRDREGDGEIAVELDGVRRSTRSQVDGAGIYSSPSTPATSTHPALRPVARAQGLVGQLRRRRPPLSRST